jgi:hypothetical protein
MTYNFWAERFHGFIQFLPITEMDSTNQNYVNDGKDSKENNFTCLSEFVDKKDSINQLQTHKQYHNFASRWVRISVSFSNSWITKFE